MGNFSKEPAGLGNQKIPETPETVLDPLQTSSTDNASKDNSYLTMAGIKINSNALNHPFIKKNPNPCADRLKEAYPDFFLLEANLAVSRYAKNLQDNKSAGSLFQTLTNYLSVDSEPRQNPVYTEYLALPCGYKYKHTYEACDEEVLYKPSQKDDSDVDIEVNDEFDEKFSINQSPLDFSEPDPNFFVDWLSPTKLVRETSGLRDRYLRPPLTPLMVVAYDAPPMLTACADNLLTYGLDV